MSEEKKDDQNEQQTFLNDHEDLLKSINDKKDTPDEPAETVQEAPAPETDSEESPAVEEPAAPATPEATEEPLVEGDAVQDTWFVLYPGDHSVAINF